MSSPALRHDGAPTDTHTPAPTPTPTHAHVHAHVHTLTHDADRHAGIDKRSYEYLVKSGVAGGIAGCAAKTVVGPLDRVKILFQTQNPQFAKYAGSWAGFPTAVRDMYAQAGVRGLFKGHSATLLRIFPYAGIKFLAYEQIRARLIPSPAHETPARRFVSGSLAGMVSVFATYPLEVIRVRLAFETRAGERSSLASIVRKMYAEHASPAAETPKHARTPRAGLANFFRGFTPTLLGMVPYAGASFLAHDSMSDVMRWPALAPYTVLPSSSSTTAKPAPLRYWAELATGGIAGFVSQTVSYPLEVIRRRMQVGGVVGDGRRLRITEVAGRIYAERGWRGFFVGLTIGYVKVVPMVATSFFVYERAKFYLGI
ncbi:mitochondrial carrier [Didymella exigua CBS 183.55]|uniref:Mitochondrial thiamine pyrophosphate carrier 1 n=1 Tax=Didymella exigua CBS 183.55 TaxID=1150837 RepID=A0A6A5R8C5_9PLEO|nr:mitochondrial carrier [Didymella exigua CBS 183.55]KAF1924445.1 mitochondrial carrier [Didymella exigua CBS 183.55]